MDRLERASITHALNQLNSKTEVGDFSELITYQTRAGTFATIEAPPPSAGLEWTPEYGATSFRLKLR